MLTYCYVLFSFFIFLLSELLLPLKKFCRTELTKFLIQKSRSVLALTVRGRNSVWSSQPKNGVHIEATSQTKWRVRVEMRLRITKSKTGISSKSSLSPFSALPSYLPTQERWRWKRKQKYFNGISHFHNFAE